MRNESPLTAPGRLKILLPWLNGPDRNNYQEGPWEIAGRRAIRRFLASFDGSTAAGDVEVLRRDKSVPRFIRAHQPPARAMDWDTLTEVQANLTVLLEAGFGGPGVIAGSMPLPSLRFGVRNLHRAEIKLSMARQLERRTYTAPGAFVLQVTGSERDLVMYLTLHLLTASDMAGALGRCPAPLPLNRQERCNRWFITRGHGRKREHCSDACRVRKNQESKRKKKPKD